MNEKQREQIVRKGEAAINKMLADPLATVNTKEDQDSVVRDAEDIYAYLGLDDDV